MNKVKHKNLARFFLIAILNVVLIAALAAPIGQISASALSRYGSRGTEVTQVQKNLKYYRPIDGIAGSATLRILGVSSSGGYGKYSSSDYNLIARIISAEARGEPLVGQVAVGAVILNRVEHPSFPNTVAGVVYQPGAFSCLNNGQFNQPVASSAYRAAQLAINGWDPSNGAIYYYNPATAKSSWILSRPVVLRIGNHVFCK